MRWTAAFVLVSCSLQLHAESWYGFCIVEHEQQRICTEPQPRQGDFSPVCDYFAEQEGASRWRARFSNNLDYLRSSMPDYCDQIRGEQPGSMFACQIATLCPGSQSESLEHLASRVYARSNEEAIESCLNKESWTYTRKLQENSSNGCFVRVAVEPLSHWSDAE